MNEIKVCHSVWKTLLIILTDLLIVALGVYGTLKGIAPVIAWFLIIFFSFAVLITAYPLLKERITRQPYLTITDEYVQVDSRKLMEIRYADVDSFQLKQFLVDRMIVVNYRSEKATPAEILVSNLTVKPKDLLAILNDCLENYMGSTR